MPSLDESKQTTFVETRDDGTKIYVREDPDIYWSIDLVPFSGYIIALILNAAIQAQNGSSTPHPYNASFAFFRPPIWTKVEVHVRPIQQAAERTVVSVEMWQKGKLTIQGHMIFGDFDKQVGASTKHPNSALCPFQMHPAKAERVAENKSLRYQNHVSTSRDLKLLAQNNQLLKAGRTVRGVESNSWIQLKGSKEGGVEADTLGAFVDMSVPVLASLADTIDYPVWFRQYDWHAMLTMNIEFKTKFPLDTRSGAVDSWTLGNWTKQRTMTNGKYSDLVELWTAPCAVDSKREVDRNWREKMVCVAQAYTTGIAYPLQFQPGADAKVQSRL